MKKLLVLALVMALVMVGSVMTADDTATAPATVTVSAFLSVTIDDATLAFGSLDPLATAKPADDPLVATIGAESNVNALVATKANQTNFVSGSYAFAVSNMEWNSTDSFPGTGYTTSDATVCPDVAPAGTCSIYHELTIPSGQAAGAYEVGIIITATST